MKSNVKTLGLTDMFFDTNLKPGMVLELLVTKPGWIGKSFQYEIRSAHETTELEDRRTCAYDQRPRMGCLLSGL